MDGQDHKTTTTSTGHEGHGVYLCHICGWPFPNPHPSAKHRRAHKRVCGKIEGYKIIHSEEYDDHLLAVSDDEHASDEVEHTPSPNLVKKNVESTGRLVEKSNKSEDDVFSDAVTDFSDSGVSPRLEERFESVREVDKSMEQKGVVGDLNGSGSIKVDETDDRTEQSNDQRRSEETSNPEPLVNRNNQSGNVIPIIDTSVEAVSVGLKNGIQPEYIVGGNLQREINSGHDADIHVKENELASVTLDSEEGKISDHTLQSLEREEEICDKLVSEVVKHDLPPETGTLQNFDASEGVNSGAHSAEISTSARSVEVALVDETLEDIDASVGVKEVSHSSEDIRSIEAVGEHTLIEESLLSTPSVKPDEGSQTLDATNHSDAASTVSSIDKEVEPKNSLAGGEKADSFDADKGEKCDTVPAPDSADNSFAPEDDQTTTAFKKDVDHCEEKSNRELLETGNNKGEGASVEVQVILDSTKPSDKATDFPSSCAADSDARNLEESSKNESSLLESRDDGFEKSIPGHGTVGSGGIGSELNHDISDVLDNNALLTASLEGHVSPVILELPNNIHVTQNVVRVESVDVAETVSELKDNNEVVASEKAPLQSISKESTSLSTDSELLSKNSANDTSYTRYGAKASESIDTAGVTAKLDHEDNVVLSREISAPRVQEASPTSKCLDVTSPSVEESHSSEDFSTSKSVGVVSSAEIDGNVLASEKCSVTPGLEEAVPSPLDFQDLHETSAPNVEDSKSLQAKIDDKLTEQKDGVSAIDISGSSSGRADSLEGNCGSVVSDTLETNSQKHKPTTEEARSDKSDTFEPPSFMTLVQSGGERDKVKAATEIETVQNNQQPKPDALQAGWFPSLTNVVNESEGRKKNEEVIAKVTNWSTVKQQHGPLKSLLSEVKSPNTKQVPLENQKGDTETKDTNAGVTTVGSVLRPETPATKDQDTNKDVEEWNSPARYPIEIKKEKKKRGRSYWVPFVCCSSVHRDL